MGALTAVLGLSSVVVCSVMLLVILGIAALVWFWKRQPDQRTSASAPTPPIQSTIANPTSAAQPPAAPPAAAPVAQPPAAPPAPPAAPPAAQPPAAPAEPPVAQPPSPPSTPPSVPPSADA
jgi:hypothetical protein